MQSRLFQWDYTIENFIKTHDNIIDIRVYLILVSFFGFSIFLFFLWSSCLRLEYRRKVYEIRRDRLSRSMLLLLLYLNYDNYYNALLCVLNSRIKSIFFSRRLWKIMNHFFRVYGNISLNWYATADPVCRVSSSTSTSKRIFPITPSIPIKLLILTSCTTKYHTDT